MTSTDATSQPLRETAAPSDAAPSDASRPAGPHGVSQAAGASQPADPANLADSASARPTPLVRSRIDRYLGGVCGGLAVHLGIDVTLLRILMVVLAIIGNLITVPLYLACWVIMSEEPAAPVAPADPVRDRPAPPSAD